VIFFVINNVREEQMIVFSAHCAIRQAKEEEDYNF